MTRHLIAPCLALSALFFLGAAARATPLIDAIRKGRAPLIRNLINLNVNVNEGDAVGARPLHWAARLGNNAAIRLLLAHGANVNAPNRMGGTPLHWAAKSDHYDTLALLASQPGARVNAVNKLGMTPLMMAANAGQAPAVRILLSKGADPTLKDIRGDTAISIARERNATAVVEALSEAPSAPRAPAAPKASVVDKKEMERMIEEAVKKATASKAPAPPKRIASDADKPAYRAKSNPDNYAIVIGIEKYSDLPNASFAERDAQAVRAHLVALGYPERNIVSMIDDKAGKAAFEKNIETWLSRNVNDRSTVFFYFSGHGAPDPTTGESYLVPWDGDPQFLADTGYPVSRLYEKLGALKAKRVLVVLDSCFSGAGGRSVLARGTRPLVVKSDSAPRLPKTIISLSASSASQISGALDKQGHGLFTYYFLRGLNGGAKDGQGGVTVKSLYDYVAPNVEDAARRANREQTPQAYPSAAGELASTRLR